MGGRGASAGVGSATFERKNFGKSNVSFTETDRQYRVKTSSGTEVLSKAIGGKHFQSSTQKNGKDSNGTNIRIVTSKYIGSKGNKYTVKQRMWYNENRRERVASTLTITQQTGGWSTSDVIIKKGW